MRKISEYFIQNTYIDLRKTLLSGQCFRWTEVSHDFFSGFSGGKALTVSQDKNGITLHNISEKDIPYWEDYFDLGGDYPGIIKRLSGDGILREACKAGFGLTLLRQEPFETLISFIISQNNNIPRIKGIVERLCESFGERSEAGCSFPAPERLSALTVEELSVIRSGFRARYILDASRKVCNGEINLDALYNADYSDAHQTLKTITGVGDKVADCVLLFAYGKQEAFPKDVWIKRAMAEYYPHGLPECIKGLEGIAQQYLFEYIRKNPSDNAIVNT